jgi:uronate dehydrogenase
LRVRKTEEVELMRVAVTGAAGVLGSEVVAQIRQRQSDEVLRLVDMAAISDPGGSEAVQADLSVFSEARRAVTGADVVIHCAAVHPWKQYTDDQYLDWNVKATHHLLEACADAGVPRVVYTSSIAAVGYNRDVDELPLGEHVDRRPESIYAATKAMGETLCEMFSRTHGLNCVVLRPPCFIPREGDDYGVGLLGGYGDVRDVAQAHVLALGRGDIRCDVFYCTAPIPYTREDAEELRSDPRSVYCRYYPEATEFILSRPETARPLTVYYDLGRVREELGYRPQVDFGRWFAAR